MANNIAESKKVASANVFKCLFFTDILVECFIVFFNTFFAEMLS